MHIRLTVLLVLTACASAAAVSGEKPKRAIAELAGTWRCTGTVFGPEGGSPSEATLDVSPFLDGAWLQTKLSVTSGKYHYKFAAFRAFDAATKTWANVIIDNLGGHAVSSSSDAIVWTGKATGPMDIRDTETLVSENELKMLGQYSKDGVVWNTGYDLTCRR